MQMLLRESNRVVGKENDGMSKRPQVVGREAATRVAFAIMPVGPTSWGMDWVQRNLDGTLAGTFGKSNGSSHPARHYSRS